MTNSTQMLYVDPFVIDGCDRARAAIEPRIRRQVIAQFAEQLRVAGFWTRLRLRLEIEREVDRRLECRAPSAVGRTLLNRFARDVVRYSGPPNPTPHETPRRG